MFRLLKFFTFGSGKVFTLGASLAVLFNSVPSPQQARDSLVAPFVQPHTPTSSTAAVVLTEDAADTCTARYSVHLANINDVVTLTVNHLLIAKARWGYQGHQPFGPWKRTPLRAGDSGEIDLTSALKSGKNMVDIQLVEKYPLGHSTLSVVLKRDNDVLFADAVDTRSGHQGIVYTKNLTIVRADCTAKKE